MAYIVMVSLYNSIIVLYHIHTICSVCTADSIIITARSIVILPPATVNRYCCTVRGWKANEARERECAREIFNSKVNKAYAPPAFRPMLGAGADHL